MKKSIIAATVAAACVAPQAFAQSANFQGFSVGLGVNAANASNELSDNAGSKKYSDSDNNATLQLQYNMALGDAFVVGLGGTSNLGDLRAGKVGTSQIKIKDAYSLYVAPGYAVNNSWLVYGKVAYLNANEKSDTGNSVSFDNGWGLGLGVQALFNKNWFGQFEYMASDYGEKNIGTATKSKLKSDVFSLGVGYKF